MHTPIRIGTDPAERQTALVAARERALAQSKRFLRERSDHLRLDRAYTEQERFETDSGDYVALGFDIVPLGERQSAKRVFDMLFFQIRNIEITFSEMMGHIAIRENDDTGDVWLSQHRLVATIAPDAAIEANVVVFADFERSDSGEDFGIIVLDWIDDDELYPYRPRERVRRDTSCIFTVQTHVRSNASAPSPPSQSASANSSRMPDDANSLDVTTSESSVVLMRWSQTKLHKSPFHDFDVRVTHEMRASIGTWGDRMLQVMHERAHSSSSNSTT